MNKLSCVLGEEEIEVSKKLIEFLERHHYIDVFKDGKYLFTLKRLEDEETVAETPEERYVLKECPELLKATKENAYEIGIKCWRKLCLETDKPKFTWRVTAGIIADLLNRRLGTHFDYMAFYGGYQ